MTSKKKPEPALSPVRDSRGKTIVKPASAGWPRSLAGCLHLTIAEHRSRDQWLSTLSAGPTTPGNADNRERR